MRFYHFLELYGMFNEVLWILVLLFVCYLLFILHRHHQSLVSRAALLASGGWAISTVVGTAMLVYNNVAYKVGLPSLSFISVDSLWWHLFVCSMGLCFLMAACCFLGLAIKERRSKRRVARGGKT